MILQGEMERDLIRAGLEAVAPHLALLPRPIWMRIARALAATEPATASNAAHSGELFRRAVGGSNWVLARRTPRIVEKYGADVICLTRKAYIKAERLALEFRAQEIAENLCGPFAHWM